jgi:hypothetical protein
MRVVMERCLGQVSAIMLALLIACTHAALAQSASVGEMGRMYPGRAVWIWKATRNIVLDAQAREAFFAFAARNPPLTRIFLAATWAIRVETPASERAALRSFLVQAHERGLVVDLLAGDKKWATPEGYRSVDQLLDDLARWQTSAVVEGLPSGIFDGLQLDVEPYLLAEWPSPELFEGWIGMTQRVRHFLDDRAHLQLVFGLAIPIWLDKEKYQFINEPLQAASDYVALMDYRDSAARVIRDALGEIEVADRLGKIVYVGVNTQDVKGDPPSTTFFQEGRALMEEELAKAAEELVQYPSFAGFAIHHFESYTQLKP